MNNYLIITWNMAPYTHNWGGCQRMYYLAEHLCNNGHKVDVICAYEGKYDIGNCPSFKVDAYTAMGKKVEEPKSSCNVSRDKRKVNIPTRLSIKRRKLLYSISSFVLAPLNLFFNDENKRRGTKVYSWVNFNWKYIKESIIDNAYDKVIISGPPHTLFFMARRVEKLGVCTVLDYRDPWNTWRKGYPLSKYIEKKILKGCSKVVCTNENMQQSLISDFGVDANKVYVVGNGYSKYKWDKLYRNIERCNEKFVLSYIGSINLSQYASFRNCENLISAYIDFHSMHHNVEMKLIGVNDYEEELKQKYHKLGIEIKGKVSVEESFEEMVASEALIVMHTANDVSGKFIVSAKMYDYIASERPIIGIGHQHDLHRKIIEKNGLGIFCNNNKEDILSAFNLMYNKWINGKVDVRKEKIEKNIFTREYQNKIYQRILEE